MESNKLNGEQLKNIFHQLLADNVLSLFLLDEKANVISYNDNAAKLLGFDLQLIKNSNFHTLFSKETKVLANEQFEAYKTLGTSERTVVEVVNHSGIKTTSLSLSFSEAVFNGISFGYYGLLSQIDEGRFQSFNYLSDIIDHLDASIWAADYRTKKYIHVSHGTEKIYGYSSKDFYNDPLLWAKVIYPEDLPRVQQGQKKLKEKAIPIESEYRIYHKSGEIRWISDKIIPKVDADGKIIKYTGIINDITAKKEAEQKLKESQQKYQSLYEFNPFAVFTLDNSGKFIDGNLVSEQLMGYSASDLLGKSFLPLLAEGYGDIGLSHFQKVFSTGVAQNFNVSIVHRDQRLIKINITYIPVIINDQIVGVHGIAQDLTVLQDSEEKYRNLVEQSLVGIYIIQDDRFVFVNKTFKRIFENEHVIGKKAVSVIHEDDRLQIEENLKSRFAGKEIPLFEAKALKGDNTPFFIEILGTVTTFNGRPAVTGMVIDVTYRKNIEKTLSEKEYQLKLKEERFRSLIEYSADIVKVLDETGVVQYEGLTLENNSKSNMHNMIGESCFEFISPEDVEYAKKKFQKVLSHENKPFRYELRVKHEDGSYADYEVTAVNRLSDPSIKGVVFNFKDITARKNAQQKVHHLAYHDDLTGIPNRRFLLENIEAHLVNSDAKKQNFALLFFDIDGFKFVNDSLGHFAGDELIKQVAERLTNYTGTRDFVARNGGDEFTIIVDDTNVEKSKDYAKKILQLFKAPFQLNNYDFYITVSVGVAMYPEAGESVQSLLKNADIAMYKAKELGKNNFQIYTRAMEQKAVKAFTLRNDLRKALDNEEFSIHYQPRINIATNEIIGAEALIRWEHPKFGFVSPMEFIPLAEETGLIIPISNWVLETVCKHQREWLDKGLPPIKTSVNFSALQFLQKDLIETILDIFKKTKVNPENIEIEITESVVMENEDIVLGTIEKLKAMGIKIAIDDFGTGYSSISYIKKYKIDILKIDRSFIKAIPRDNDSVELTNATIQLAQSLKLGIVAEGVETADQLNMLKQSGCKEVQGYLYSKPVPENDFRKLLSLACCLPQQ